MIDKMATLGNNNNGQVMYKNTLPVFYKGEKKTGKIHRIFLSSNNAIKDGGVSYVQVDEDTRKYRFNIQFPNNIRKAKVYFHEILMQSNDETAFYPAGTTTVPSIFKLYTPSFRHTDGVSISSTKGEYISSIICGMNSSTIREIDYNSGGRQMFVNYIPSNFIFELNIESFGVDDAPTTAVYARPRRFDMLMIIEELEDE
jgi:hypothetical protein